MAPRLSGEERREAIVAAAAIEFAKGGYEGTSAEVIAHRAGVSQPYLFQLFGTKKELFLAVVRDCFARTGQRFEESARATRAEGGDTEAILHAMGHAYVELLLEDRSVLRLQLHSYAACGDPEIQAVVRNEYLALWQRVSRVSGASAEDVHWWFAEGMLINVIASIDNSWTFDEFGHALFGSVPMKA